MLETQDGVLVRQPEPLVLGLRDLAIVYSEVSSTPATSSLRARAAQGRICGVLGRVPTRGWTGPSHVRRCPLQPPRPTLHVCDGLWPMVCEPLRAPGPTSPHPGPFLLHPVPQGSPGKPTLWSHAPLPCPGPQIRPLDRVFLPWEPLEAGQRLRDTGSSCRNAEATPMWEFGRVTEGRQLTPPLHMAFLQLRACQPILIGGEWPGGWRELSGGR